jgi:hypothetical protein
MLADDLHLRIVNAATGELLRELAAARRAGLEAEARQRSGEPRYSEAA